MTEGDVFLPSSGSPGRGALSTRDGVPSTNGLTWCLSGLGRIPSSLWGSPRWRQAGLAARAAVASVWVDTTVVRFAALAWALAW